MKILLPFLKPYRRECALILFIVLVDVGGSLLIPTIAADRINIAIAGSEIGQIAKRGILMLAALFIMRKASPIFDRLQRFLARMNKTFAAYAESSIQANHLFAGLDCLATAVINLIIVAILYVEGMLLGLGAWKSGISQPLPNMSSGF